MSPPITATMLYDFVRCPHRVALDHFEDPGKKDPENPFVQLLWEKGHAFEREVIQGLGKPFVNLKPYKDEEKERLTREAMERGDVLIYGGRISADDLLGEPDLLRRRGEGYEAGDIKSGAGEEAFGEDAAERPKKHYAVQLALYTDILERMGKASGRRPFVWDVHGEEVAYDLEAPQGVRTPATLWSLYETSLKSARAILEGREKTLPALGGICKLCHWHTACTRRLAAMDDLTLIPELGRSRRDAMLDFVNSVQALAKVDLDTLVKGGRSVVPRVGPGKLKIFQERARLQTGPDNRPYLREPADLPAADLELFFDIETDPMRDVCYLHGFLERRHQDKSTEKYVAFLAEKPTEDEERRAFAEAWEYVKDCASAVIYYYSPYERTWWRKLRARYPRVAAEDEIEAMFSKPRAVDLYMDVVQPKTVWPTRDYSIKTLATFLGFRWRDPHPSGAASIEWYHQWVESDDAGFRQRILDYNEDDCAATRVLLDGIRGLRLKP